MSKQSRTEKRDGLLELERPRPTSLPPLPDHPLVSVIMASRNLRPYVEDTIRSVLDQDYDRIELLVIDGASTDGTLEILHKYDSDPRVRWVSEPDSGPLDAINKGIRLAEGDLLGLQLISDTYQPYAIREMVQEFLADPRVALVRGWIQYIDASGGPVDRRRSFNGQRFDFSVDQIVRFGDSFVPIQATLLRRDLVLAIGGLNEESKFEAESFYVHYMLEAARLGFCLRTVPRVWANIRVHLEQRGTIPEYSGVALCKERSRGCKRVAKLYRDFLTPQQTRTLRRTTYYLELKQRILYAHQTWQALPAALGYLRFGGGPHLLRHLVNRLRGRI